MNQGGPRDYHSHGTGSYKISDFRSIGRNVVIEEGALVFNPQTIILGDNVYVGHYTILKGYHKNEMRIGDNTWIGQLCFLHSAGGIRIGKSVGVGPGVKILTSVHGEGALSGPVIDNQLEFGEVVIDDGCDIGMGAIILPGVHVGKGAIIGAGSVVTKDVEGFTVVAGNPAKLLRKRA
ncbi:MAG: acyltransferase [Methanomassiliicoccales archaeon]|nr:acyltransferase [Methanomassiliicoccales archaeon]